MQYNKQPLDYPDLIALLKERGLLFHNVSKATEQLKVISYFRLASYLRPMEENKETHQYKPNSYFENAIDLYYFDKELRSLVFTAIQSFEVALRSKVINLVSIKYGAFWFMNRELSQNVQMFQDNLLQIQREVFRSKEDFIKEHFERYTEPILPPVWKTLEVVSFGMLSKLYCNLNDNKVKKQIARELGLPQHEFLESWSKCAVALRNCLAHHSRTWNRKFPLKPQMPHSLKSDWLSSAPKDKTKLYAQLCCLVYLQNVIHPNNNFANRVKNLLSAHPNVDISAMGFPANWQEEPLWKQ